MDGFWIIATMFVMFYVPLALLLFGRRGRWYAAAGWLLVTGGALTLFGGGGDAFPWAGLLWSAVILFGMMLLAMDIAALRRRLER